MTKVNGYVVDRGGFRQDDTTHSSDKIRGDGEIVYDERGRPIVVEDDPWCVRQPMVTSTVVTFFDYKVLLLWFTRKTRDLT